MAGKYNKRAAVVCFIGGILLLISSYETHSFINYVPYSFWIGIEKQMPLITLIVNGLFCLASLGLIAVFLGSLFIYIKQKLVAGILIGISTGINISSVAITLIPLFSNTDIGIPGVDLLLYAISAVGITGLGIVLIVASMWL